MSDAHVGGENATTKEATTRDTAPRRSYDLAALVAFVVVAALLLAVLDSVFLRTLVGVPVVTFAPGYALVAALLPARQPDASDPGSLDRVERVAVAIGASVSLVVLGALLLSPFFPGGLATVPFLELLVAWTLLGAMVGYVRRRGYPPEVRDGVVDPRDLAAEGRIDLLDLVLVVAVVVAFASVGHGLAAPGPDEPHANVTLVTENDAGELVAGGYPDSAARGESVGTSVLIENSRDQQQNYTVVVVLERLGPSNQTVQRSQLERETLTVASGEQAVRELTVEPDLLGDSLRLSYYVYAGAVDANPSPDAADHHLYLWLSVTESGTDDRAAAADTDGDDGDDDEDEDDEEDGDERLAGELVGRTATLLAPGGH